MSLSKNTQNGNSAVSDDFKILSRIKDAQTDGSLKASESRLYTHLMLCAGKAGETTWGHGALAKAVHVSERQSQRITKKLHRNGFLKSTQRGMRRVNRYVMPWHSEFSEATPVADQEPLEVTPETDHHSLEVTPMSFQEPPPMSFQEATPVADPIVKEAYVKEAYVKDTPQLARLASVCVSDQTPLELEAELCRLTAARPGFLGNPYLNQGTVKTIWKAATGKIPNITVRELMLYLLRCVADGRNFDHWGGVIDVLIREEMTLVQNQPAEILESVSAAPFNQAQFIEHCNFCAAALMKIPSPTFSFDEVIRNLINETETAEYYMENLEESEDRLLYFEKKTVDRVIDQLTPAESKQFEQAVQAKVQPYRARMTADQAGELERQAKHALVFETYPIPRFSLFYLDTSKKAPKVEKPYRDIAQLSDEKQGDVLLEEWVDCLNVEQALREGFLGESDLENLIPKSKLKNGYQQHATASPMATSTRATDQAAAGLHRQQQSGRGTHHAAA